MNAVISETLRVRPVVPIVARSLQQELEVGGYRLPAGTTVAPAIYLTNRNPRVYERPAEFMPERFLARPPRRSPGSPSAAASGGASGPPSRPSR